MKEWMRDTIEYTRQKPIFVLACLLVVLSPIMSAAVALGIRHEINERLAADCRETKARVRDLRGFGELLILAAESNGDGTPPNPEAIETFRNLLIETFPEPEC